jgi:beta-phosphoglucomutase-like phosphatase (HAD superfamily)
VLEAVIFDFDGLILETETPEVRSWEHVFNHYGGHYPEWYCDSLSGAGRSR